MASTPACCKLKANWFLELMTKPYVNHKQRKRDNSKECLRILRVTRCRSRMKGLSGGETFSVMSYDCDIEEVTSIVARQISRSAVLSVSKARQDQLALTRARRIRRPGKFSHLYLLRNPTGRWREQIDSLQALSVAGSIQTHPWRAFQYRR